jgi:hypothetical protein
MRMIGMGRSEVCNELRYLIFQQLTKWSAGAYFVILSSYSPCGPPQNIRLSPSCTNSMGFLLNRVILSSLADVDFCATLMLAGTSRISITLSWRML